MMPTMVRVLTPAESEAYVALRREALREAPLAFASSPEDDHALAPDFVRDALARPQQAALLMQSIERLLADCERMLTAAHTSPISRSPSLSTGDAPVLAFLSWLRMMTHNNC